MPRHGPAQHRDVEADTRYQNKLVTKIINFIMRKGDRAVAEKLLYGAMDIMEKKGMSAINTVKQAVENAKPQLEVRARRVGGANYQVPVEVRPERRTALALRWIMASSVARTEKSMVEKLAGELIDAANNAGGAIRKKEEVHKMAESNRAFAHYRW